MKKLSMYLILGILSILLTASFGYAKTTITESPDIKIVIDGKMGSYADVPIMVNSRTLLPLREVLVNLGVSNDSKHIVWNKNDKSIKVLKGDITIDLHVGKASAKINGKNTVLDTAPIIYKNKTYIPARFVAQSMGKKVVWDNNLKAVLIRDEASFNEIKDILDKSNAAMKSLNKCRLGGSIELGTSGAKTTIDISGVADVKNETAIVSRIIHNQGASVTQDVYIKSNYVYIHVPTIGKWAKLKMSEDQANEAGVTLSNLDTLSSLLSVSTESTEDQMILKGNADIPGFKKFVDSGNYLSNQCVVTIYIDMKTSRFIKTIEISSGDFESLGNKYPFVFNTVTEFSDFDGDFDVVMPEDVDTNAIES